jgi:glycosyltransferase involved in cell wall biosynthesis
MDTALISVIIPIFNRHNYANRAVTSVLAQSHKNWELFIIDDNSNSPYLLPDSCKQLIQNVTILRNERNIGPGLSRQRGLDLAIGEYVCFLDSDDYWKPDFLAESIVVHAANPELAATYCQSEMTDGILRRRNNIEDAVDDIFYGVVSGVRPWATCALMWKRKYLAKWNSIRTNQDALFELETSVKNHRIKMIAVVLCVIDKETGNNAQNIVGVEKGNINRAKVLLKANKTFRYYAGNKSNSIKSALWYSLYAQMKKMIKQREIYLAAKVATSLIFRIHWKFKA